MSETSATSASTPPTPSGSGAPGARATAGDSSLEDLLERAAAAVSSPDRPDEVASTKVLLRRYYQHVFAGDLAARDPLDVAGAALSHRDLAAVRTPGTHLVRLLTPTVDTFGWRTGHSIVQVVTDDMPFLVDSVAMALNNADRNINVVVHPQLLVRRDENGNLLEVLDEGLGAGPARERPEGVIQESWMAFEIDLEPDVAEADALVAEVDDVLDDVVAAVTDWGPMRQVATETAEALPDAVPATLAEEALEAQRLLRWLANDHFTFLGYREYEVVDEGDNRFLRSLPGTGLGILRQDPEQGSSSSFSRLDAQSKAKALDPAVLVLTKANSRSRVHRPAYLDYVGIKTFDSSGAVVGEKRFLGLLAAAAYTSSVTSVPVADKAVSRVLERAGFTPESHPGKDLMAILETYPRDELLHTDADTLYDIAIAVLHMQERRQTRMFLRPDTYGRFVSALVYLPRDRYNTDVRLRIMDILTQTYGAASVDFSARLSESVLTRLHFVVRMPAGTTIPDVDEEALGARVTEATRSWEEDFRDELAREVGEGEAARTLRQWRVGDAYKSAFPGRAAVGDIKRLEQAREEGPGPNAAAPMNLYQPLGESGEVRRIKLYRSEPLSLTEILPYFRNLGLEVIDERPYDFYTADGERAYLYDFGLRSSAFLDAGPSPVAASRKSELLSDALRATWNAQAESDGLNQLVLGAGLTWREVVILRTYVRYLRQISSTYSQDYIEATLLENAGIARSLVDLFAGRFDPDAEPGDPAQHRAAGEQIVAGINEALDDVASLDADRILRALLELILATERSNYYQLSDDGLPKPHVSLKMAPQRLTILPKPVPAHEIWVYSPRVEGVHIRFGDVARGGLRWSDRREDFRTEVLGLVKAQMVKNAVIVPSGAKGGFVARQLPDPSDRDAWMAEGIASYKTFIRGLLDVTDNLVTGQDGTRDVVPPPRVVRHDGDDSYLVVAADKGTASFSDIANGVSAEYGFWLGDAFASGGSAGYDHKAMGITARGAWESVKRHFREMDLDTQSEPFTVVGVGDMSGDVFGNGMLLSEQIKLVAAFDHRHVFIDPDPDPASSFAERRRLFELPRSSWADYDASLISDGGGVHPLSAKSVEITPQVREVLGLADDVTRLSPLELKRAVLAAPVDLLWNGGIGTYVKASDESDAQVGDKANDAIRISGRDLRVKVVGEGGNLGFTQRGRIEASLAGVRINTDAIDNSAGVDCSDHEVNIKILLNQVVNDGDLTLKQRDVLLEEMTDEVGALVLRTNYEQNVLLGNARGQSDSMASVHRRLLDELEASGLLDRALEFLPSDAELVERVAETGTGLSSPEFAVLVAYTKIAGAHAVLETSLPDDPWFAQVLTRYFPQPLVERFPRRLESHPLRREIITTWVVNDMVNRGGISFVYRAMEETGADVDTVLRAYMIAREVFGLSEYVSQVEALDNVVDTGVQTVLYLEMRRLLDRATRWFIHNRPSPLDVAAEIDRFSANVRSWKGRMGEVLVGSERARYERGYEQTVQSGVGDELALRMSGLLDEFSILDATEVGLQTGHGIDVVLRLYCEISEHYGIDVLLNKVSALPRDNRWQALARGALRDDLYAAQMGLTATILEGSTDLDHDGVPDQSAAELIATWEGRNTALIGRARATMQEVSVADTSDLASMSVVLRLLRQVIRSGTGA